MYIADLFEYTDDRTRRLVVVYPGRFQPFHQGHAGVYHQLEAEFGRGNVYIATSNKSDDAKSPFNFADRIQLMHAAGVPDNHILQVAQPYNPEEYAKLLGYDPANTVLVVAVGEPDRARLNPDGVTKKDKKDPVTGQVISPAGSPTYFKSLTDLGQVVPSNQHGYVRIVPEVKKDITVGDKTMDASHGTQVRQIWNMVRNNPQQRKQVLDQLYGRGTRELAHIFDKIPLGEADIISTDSSSPVGSQKLAEHIVKVKGGYELKSKKTGKNLGKYPTRAGAEKRERQVQYFKHAHEGVAEGSSADAHTAMAIAKELYQNLNDLFYIYGSKSTTGAGNPHNIQSLRNEIVNLNQDLKDLGYEYDPKSPGMIRLAPGKRFENMSHKDSNNKKLYEFAQGGGEGGGNYLHALASAWYNHDIDMLKDILRQGGSPMQRIIDAQVAVEKILARGIHCGDGRVRKYHIDYNANFNGVEIQSYDHYEYSDYDAAGREVDSRTGQPWGPYDVVEFRDQDLNESLPPEQVAKLLALRQQMQQQRDAERSAPLSPEKQAELDRWAQDFQATHGSRTFAQDNPPAPAAAPAKPDWRTLPGQTRGEIRTQKQKMDQLLAVGTKLQKLIDRAERVRGGIPPGIQSDIENVENSYDEANPNYDYMLELYTKVAQELEQFISMKRALYARPRVQREDVANGSLNEYAPPTPREEDPGGDDPEELSRWQRWSKLLEIATGAAVELQVGDLPIQEAAVKIRNDHFFGLAVRQLLPNISRSEMSSILKIAYYTAKKNPGVAEGAGAQQAAIAIAKRESGRYTKDGKRKQTTRESRDIPAQARYHGHHVAYSATTGQVDISRNGQHLDSFVLHETSGYNDYYSAVSARVQQLVEMGGVGVVRGGSDPRYMTATMGNQNSVTGATLGQEMKAFGLTGRRNPGLVRHQRNVKKSIGRG